MSRSVRYSIVFLFVLSFLLSAGAFWLASREDHANDRKWCSTLDLLTSHPAPKPADPALHQLKQQQWEFYSDFLSLRHSLGCG